MASTDLFSPLSSGPLSSSPINPVTPGAITPAAAGGGGNVLADLLGIREQPLPGQYGQVASLVPGLTSTSDALKTAGGNLSTAGAKALSDAEAGTLTPEQQAELKQYQTGLTNQARQQFYSMGRTPDKDTAFISTTADIDAKVNAMAQQEIQTTIQLGLGELSAGQNFFGTSLGFDQAGINALLSAGQAQVQLDQNYNESLTKAYSAIFSILGNVAGYAFKGGGSPTPTPAAA